MRIWAVTLALLGAFYLFWAFYWPSIFQRALTRSAQREKAGYRVGFIVHWRLPYRAALPIAVMIAAPLLATFFLSGRLLPLLLVVASFVLCFVWLFTTPGSILQQVEIGHAGGQPLFELKLMRKPARSLLVFILFGLLPSLALGVPLGRWLSVLAVTATIN